MQLSELKTVKIACFHYGTAAPTPKMPTCEYTPENAVKHEIDLSAEKTVDINTDFWMDTQVKLWAVHDFILPSWMPAEEWLKNMSKLEWFWSVIPPTLPESYQRQMFELYRSDAWSFEDLYAVSRLFVTNLRSAFKISVKAQLITKLEQGWDRERYPSPLSPKQLRALNNKWLLADAQAISRGLYDSTHYSGYKAAERFRK